MDGDFSDQTNQNWMKYRDLTVGFCGLPNGFRKEEKEYAKKYGTSSSIRKVL